MITRASKLKNSKRAGVTILEILVVLGILALLAAVVAPRVVGYLGRAKSETANLQIKRLAEGVELFYIDTGRYPTEAEGLTVLKDAPTGTSGWAGPYINSEEAFRDPWKRDYIYEIRAEGVPFSIESLGRDGASGGSGEDRDLSSQR